LCVCLYLAANRYLMVKKSLVWLYGASTALLWLGIIVLAGSVLSLRYYLLPHVKDYKDRIAVEASQLAGRHITIGDIEANWDGLSPHLELYKVDVFDQQGQPALHLDHVETSLSWLSLPLLEPRLSKLVIHQPDLLIRRAVDGNIFVAGISISEPGESDLPNWLLRQSSISVDDATVVWQDDLRRAAPLALNKLSLQISTPPWEGLLGHHRFGLRATPSAGASTPIDVRGNVWGSNVDRPEAWRGTLYAKLEGTDIAAWRAWLDYPFDLTQGFGATQFWLDFAKGQAEQVTADVVLANVRTRFGKGMPETGLQNLSGRLSWHRLADGNELQGERLQFATANGFSMKNGSARVAIREQAGKDTLEGRAALDEIDLEPFAAFAEHLPLGKQLQKILADLAPKGRLQQVEFSWQGDRDAAREYSIHGHFADLGIGSVQNYPAFSGLSGALDATEKGGALSIDARNAQLDLKGALRWPIPADRLTGKVTWQNSNGVVNVKVSKLAIANQHMSGNLDADYRYDGKKGGYLDLNGKFGNANGKYARFYYPTVLSKETLEWLDSSVLNVHAEDINIVIKGYLDDFPYPNNTNGEFKISARFTDGVLDYADGWPKIEGMRLNMLFHGDRMDMDIDQGHIYGGHILKAKVAIPSLEADHPVVEIQGEMQAPAADALKFVNTSPVIETIDHFTDHMQASGSGKVLLELHVPIENPEATRVKGSYLVSNGTVVDPDLPSLDHVNGKLEFTESSLRAQNVSANIYGGPGKFSLETGKDGLLKVTARGKIGEAGIRQIVNHPLAQKVHGAADWSGEVNLRNRLTTIDVRSQLAGLSVALPPPFGKNATENVPFRFERRQQNDKQELMSITYGNAASARLLRVERNGALTLERGAIGLGGATAELPAQRGIVVNGKLANLDWEQWSSLLPKPEETKDSGSAELSALNLNVGALDIFGRRINDLSLSAKAVSDGWQATVQSREASGDLQWQGQGNGKIFARLKSLTFPDAAPAKLSEPKLSAAAEQTPADNYPALDIVAEHFEANQKTFGRLELLANQQGGDWSIEKLKVSNPDNTLNMNGEWRNWRRHPNTRLNLTWEVGDVGKTLDRFGYPGTIKGGSGTLSGQIRWPGSPHEFSLASLSGNLQLDTGKGQFLKIQPGVGRLLGILSLQSLPRRLLFDFRDVFSDGFGFNKISTSIRIDKGIMRSDDFRMDGPAAKVALSGETDLDRETLNLHIQVTPSLSDSLSVAAFAGGPVAGAAAFVAQKLLRDPFSRLAAYEYDVTGTWDNPQEVKSEKSKAPPPATPGSVPAAK
jgi:uncharacterized protein (TIGR02099 family)